VQFESDHNVIEVNRSSKFGQQLHSFAGLTIQTIASESALRSLESGWNNLSERVVPRNAFATFGWYSAWSRFYSEVESHGRFRPEVLVFRQNGILKGIAPLVRRVSTKFGFRMRRLEFVSIHSDYNQLVIGDEQEALTNALFEYLARTSNNWDAIDLRDLSDDDEGVKPIEQALLEHALPYRTTYEYHPCPYMTLEGGAEAQNALLSGQARRVLRNRKTRAEREAVRIRLIEHPELESGLLETIIRLEREKHKRSEFPTFIEPHRSVFRELFDQLGPQNWLCVGLLELGPQAIAYQLSFRCGGRLWDYSKAYDRAHAHLAPGTLLLQAMFDYGFANGYTEYDFLRGQEAYKQVWSSKCHTRSRVLIWNDAVVSNLRKFIYYDLKPAIYRAMRKQDA
jgi:Protein involved in cellulose biosynthesis (CelD)